MAEDPPPASPQPRLEWYLLMLWLAPFCILVCGLFAGGFLSRHPALVPDLSLALALVPAALVLVPVGAFECLIAAQAGGLPPPSRPRMVVRILFFSLMQAVVVIPLLGMLALSLFFLFGGLP